LATERLADHEGVFKVGLLAVVALLATTAVATSAQAAYFNPDNTAVSGTSDNATFSYGALWWSCDTATADGTTGLDSDSISDLRWTFDDCVDAGGGPVEVDCVGTVTLIADPAADGTGTVELNDDFACVATLSICTVTIAGPQTTQPKNWALNPDADVLSLDVEMLATRAGSLLCGPEEGTLRLAADFAMTPSNLTIDP
jgi:hypothetical protein